MNRTPRARIMYYDRTHARKQVTIPRTERDNLFLDILDYDHDNGTDYYADIKPTTIRKVIRLD